jgi:type IV pilus assembly protein PilB
VSFAHSASARTPGRRLGQLLLEDGLVTAAQIDDAVARQRASGERLGSVLVRLGFLTEDQLVNALSRQYGLPAVAPSQLDIDPELLRLVPAQIARKYRVLPVERAGETLSLAMADPTDLNALDDVAFMTNLTVRPLVAAPRLIRQALERLGETDGGALASAVTDAERSLDGDADAGRGDEESWSRAGVLELLESADEAPVVRLINLALADAIRRGASDLHVEPGENAVRVRVRVDGVLHELMAPPKRLEAALTARMKVMAALDIAERRLPQDGRIKLRYHAREIDLRVSTLPTIFGERTVMRLLDRESLQLDLARLGFDPGSLEQFQHAIHQPHGMVLITGPTGSGKTTTLYSAINTLNRPDINIMTAEDPVEYNLPGINQVQVNEEIGRTFAAALRAFLRQDPDVILVGETRDLDTAQIGIRAALTGHLVLTTLHTNDCPSAVARLLDMGIAPFLVASSVSLILAQRLARRICRSCVETYEIEAGSLEPYGYPAAGPSRVALARGAGCAVCSFTGMKGRVAIYEVMPVGEPLRDLILQRAPTAAIRDLALRHGMKTLRQNALALALQHVTTLDEVLRVTIG